MNRQIRRLGIALIACFTVLFVKLNYILLALLIRVSDSTARRIGELPDEPTINERFTAWKLRRKLAREIPA